jgi:glycosyltransferase involved in cell wall biosynthesis
MTVSVVIPAFNAQDYLGAAIESVLSQRSVGLELIVIDDGSTDKTREVASRFGSKVTLLSQKNGGIAAARNRGISLAKGEFLAFLDADDFWTKDKLKKQLAVFEQNRGIDLVFGHVVQFAEGKKRYEFPNEPQAGYVAGTLLLRKRTFLSVGLFSTEYTRGEFIDWYVKSMLMGLKSFLCNEVLLKRRIHGNNTGIVHKEKSIEYVHILKKLLDQKREKAFANPN